jgi:hypothetical protein
MGKDWGRRVQVSTRVDRERFRHGAQERVVRLESINQFLKERVDIQRASGPIIQEWLKIRETKQVWLHSQAVIDGQVDTETRGVGWEC